MHSFIISTALDVTEGIFAVLYVSIMSLTRFCKTTVFYIYYGHPMESGRPLHFHAVVSIFFFYLLFFFSPDHSSRTLDVYHTSTHGVALVQIQNQV